MTENPKLTKKDFVSNQEVKWCPGCGDYAILSSVQLAMAQLGVQPHNVAVISGIGCSSRFPYYVDSFGMHSIHGRAPAVTSGVKIANPALDVWMITGDGDSLSIGGNHFIHILRRNIDINIVLFNNQIYGLTKGQYSPTSKQGTVTKSSPYGSLDRTFNPAELAMGSGATFYARTMDTDPKHMIETFKAAHAHKGTSLVEVLQNCVIFNDKVHEQYTARATRDDYSVRLEAGKPLVFGKDKNKGLILKGFSLEVVTIGEDGITEADLVVHDPSSRALAQMLADLHAPEKPVAIGVLRQVEEEVYETELVKQMDSVVAKKGKMNIKELINSGETWTV
ncbi:MAG: 2-oxoacid:ferredoxin oxidoreductase subunit beta [Halobacteriovoraceae bacterium]|nr:2-oxoacid:ferredoxin oxidoreductase subunit beta [Halobacteriovoraceae bacterium]